MTTPTYHEERALEELHLAEAQGVGDTGMQAHAALALAHAVLALQHTLKKMMGASDD